MTRKMICTLLATFTLTLVAAVPAFAYDRVLVMRLVCAGVVAVVVLAIGQVIVGPSTHLFLIGSSDLSGTISSNDTN